MPRDARTRSRPLSVGSIVCITVFLGWAALRFGSSIDSPSTADIAGIEIVSLPMFAATLSLRRLRTQVAQSHAHDSIRRKAARAAIYVVHVAFTMAFLVAAHESMLRSAWIVYIPLIPIFWGFGIAFAIDPLRLDGPTGANS